MFVVILAGFPYESPMFSMLHMAPIVSLSHQWGGSGCLRLEGPAGSLHHSGDATHGELMMALWMRMMMMMMMMMMGDG